jgi:hypothetical protein
MAAIGKVKDVSLADVILAVVRAADDREARTPGVITAAGSIHSRDPYDRTGTCSTCNLSHERCRAIWRDDHEYVSVHEHQKLVVRDPERIRRIIEATKGEKVPMRDPSTVKAAQVTERDHADCDEAIAKAMAAGRNGEAEYLATRCDMEHGRLTTTEETDDV